METEETSQPIKGGYETRCMEIYTRPTAPVAWRAALLWLDERRRSAVVGELRQLNDENLRMVLHQLDPSAETRPAGAYDGTNFYDRADVFLTTADKLHLPIRAETARESMIGAIIRLKEAQPEPEGR